MNTFQEVMPLEKLDYKSEVFTEKVNSGAIKHYGHISGEIQQRIEAELSIINRKGTGWYFLFMSDIVEFAKTNNIWLGPGRGAAAGSIVNFCLGITDVDPIKHELLFERFYHLESVGLPNIEIDVEIGGREKIIQYLKHIYGQNNVTAIINAQGLPHSTTIAISNNNLPEDLTIELAMELECVTLDLLPSKSITELKNLVNASQISQNGISIDISNTPLDDVKTLNLFQQGLTDGITYFDGATMQSILREFVPQSFDDLVLLFATYRPSMQDQIARLKGLKEGNILKLVPEEIKHILIPSYGLIVYQEQIMQIVEQIASFNVEDADALRKSLGKKQHQKIALFKQNFLNNGILNGYAEEVLTQIWEEIVVAGPNVFNKSHSICYTKTAFQLAYIKSNY